MAEAIAELIITLAHERQVPTLQLLADVIRGTIEKEKDYENLP